MNVFVDTAVITVRSGKGGDGCSHLRQEKDRPKGGPDGGDGGHGGDVTVVADPHLDTLIEFSYRAHFFAKDGERGMGKSCHGADGEGVSGPAMAEIASEFDDAGVEDAIVNGTDGGMPAFPSLTAQDVADLVAYVRSFE